MFFFLLFLFFFLSSRAYIIDKHLSLIDIIPILYILQPQCLSCFNELLDDAIKIVWYSLVIKTILLQLVSFNQLVVFVNVKLKA